MKPRKFERHPVRLAVRVRVVKTEEWHDAEVENISAGGALVRCHKAAVHFGERIDIEVPQGGRILIPATVTYAEAIEFVIDEEEIDASEVRWSDNAAGLFGVRFDLTGSKIAAQLMELIGRLADTKPPESD